MAMVKVPENHHQAILLGNWAKARKMMKENDATRYQCTGLHLKE
jgi:hypothetical protein